MMDQELLQDFTESYLKAVVSEASDRLQGDFDSRAAFGELGIDSFQVLKIIKKLEGDFGPLPKSLLFEKFNIHDLAGYFAEKHEKTLSARFAEKLRGAVRPAQRPREQAAAAREDADSALAQSAAPILIRETDAYVSPELKDLVGTLYARYKIEGCVSRGTRVIAPNLFIGSERRGYFNYGRSRDIVLLYGYTGPRNYVPALLEEVYAHCVARGLQINVLTADPIPPVAGTPFSATPFGVLQRIPNLKDFSLDGGAMRRLRYQVSKFEKSGPCRTEEYRPGSSADTDRMIAGVIDRWCESRTVVNPLVPIFKAEVLAGTVDAEHRLFLTWLNDALQNVVLITPMCAEENGYLMDLEFYLPEMPMGGLEFAIAGIIARLASEGCDVLSLGGTYGCKLEPSPTADPEIDAILDDLRAQNIFNDGGNLQFKNKFRPENRPIFLCRPVGSGNPGNVIDIIMMIADPSRTQTADEGASLAPAVPAEAPSSRESSQAVPAPTAGPEKDGGDERSRVLAAAGFNPLNLAHEHVGLDLMTDSWAQLHMPAIDAQMRHLHSRLQEPVNVDAVLRSVFPFPHFVLTSSGQAAESILFKAWPERGVVPQNLLFPTTILHQIDNGFTPKELPHPAFFEANSPEPFKGNLNLDALRAVVADDPSAIACVCIDVGNNGSGGHPVSTRHLRDVKACLAPHAIPLIIDATRVVQNALFLIDREKEHAGKGVWAVVQEILSHADVVFASLTKELCVDKGGLVAVRDAALFRKLLELADREGSGLDLIEKRLIALSLQNRGNVEAKVARKTEGARLLATALSERGVPIVHAGGGHCVLIDVKRIPEFQTLKNPVASFLAWMYGETGIRGGAHSVGMLKQTAMNDLVRLAIPAGLPREAIESAIECLGAAFANKVNIPELVSGGGETSPAAGVHAHYRVDGTRNATVKGSAESSVARPANREKSAADIKPAEAQSPRTVSKAGPRTGDIAVVGMAGRYPKAKNVSELWENLARGRDCVEEIPADRLERRRQHGSTAKYRGGFIDDVDRFDSLFFNISPREAEVMDPQERLFLEVAWEAIEDAGYYPEVLAHEDEPRDIGVFVGAVWGMYQIVGVDEQRAGNHVAPNSFLWSIANRVSYWMNLSGPSLTVDTACSSSLTALYLACEAIQAGDCSAAIVGGVNLDLHQAKLDINLIGGALSPDGVCRTFGKGANGYVAGEGVGALLLKPLDRALRDGDQVYGVIRSAVVNHGGRTSGYFVPNPAAQTNVISAALRKANVGPRTIGYVEAHGTGTELGDPLEIAGLSAAFGVDDVGHQSCAIGSIKTNIGHLEAAAGIVGMTKVLLQMKHRRLVPSLHSSEPNELIDFEHSPFYVVQKLEEWEAKELDGVRVPLRAGISSFGAGGANAHVILESVESRATEDEDPAEPPDLIFPLSARNEDQLREAAVRLVEFLRRNDARAQDVAHTLQYGRKSFEHRLAVVARTSSELIEKLTRFVDGKKDDSVVLGDVKRAEGVTRLLNRSERQEFVRLLSHGSDPHRIATLWVEGLLADWQGFESSVAGRRISLPTYPFAGKRHWIGGTPASVASAALQPVAGMHPMVDSNESTFERQLFKKTFHDRDFFIYDHMVSDIPTLPGVAYLELVRKAGEIAAGMPVRRIQNILWVSPIAVRGSVPQEVFVELKPSGDAVQFEVFSDTGGHRTLHSQGKLLYTNRDDGEPETVDLDAIRARCTKGLDGKDAYPLFKSFGLALGPSFQVLQEVYRNDEEALGVLALPEFRRSDLQSMVLHPSLVDGSMQAGMAARLGDEAGEMLVPYSIGEVEILHPLPANCLSYTTQAKDSRKDSRVLKSNVLILDATGKVLARIRESTGVPILDVHKKSETHAGTHGVSRLHYAYDWEKAPLPAEPSTPYVPQAILLFGDEVLRVEYQAGLDRAGARSTRLLLVRPGAEFRRIDEQTFEIDPRRADDFARLLETLVEQAWPIEDICFAWPAVRSTASEDDILQQSLERGVHAFLFLCQGLIQAKIERAVQLLCLYGPTAAGIQPQDEGLTGFVNTLHNEHPKLLCKTVEIRAEGSQGFDAVWAELRARTQDAVVVRHDAGERFVRKLKAFELETVDGSSRLSENGVYLITGGAGGLGLLFAEFLARRYKARLVLTGRSILSEERESRIQELRNAGADVLYRVADVSRREDVDSLLREARSRFGSIHGIIHAAGVVRDSYIRNKTPDEMAAVFAPKVLGTLNLDDATREDALDFFVTFSSLAAVTGNPGQSDYAFANAFMDSFAAERERLRAAGMRSGKSLSFNWSLWADGGMRPDEQTQLALRKTLGMELLSTEAGLDAFIRGLASDRTGFAVVEGAQEKLETAWGLRTKPIPAAAPASSTEAIAASVPAEREGSLRPWLQDELSQIVMRLLKLDAGDISPDKILMDLGFDSIGLTTFANAVNDRFQLDITPVLFFDYPSIEEIAKYLAEDRKAELLRFHRANDASSETTAAPATHPPNTAEGQDGRSPAFEIRKGWSPPAAERGDSTAISSRGGYSPELRFVENPIAIVGMSGVMPQSEDLDEFWEHLKSSRDLVTLIPPDRWRWEDYYGDPLKEANKSNSKWGAFMREIDKFDPLFFGISPREAQMMDPQQRIFLEHVWKAIEDAGEKVSSLSGTKTGVFVGVATNDYLDVMSALGTVLDGYSASGNSHSVLANRVSFLLGLRGPSAPLDTACSSSLVALHRALESIHTGSCEMAIVGGVQVMLSPAAYISFSSAGMLSPDGKCKTFDKSANGYVRGEGCGAIFLKSLAKAEADGNHIYAVVRATAENHGGRVTAMTAPNPSAQTELLIEAYEKGQVDPSTVGFIECHGTGTSLGDPIETQALGKAFAELYRRHGKAPAETPHVALSSVKTNIGHLETAAGIAGIIKALLAIRHRRIPANIHLDEVNPYISLKGTPFFIAKELTPWDAPLGADGLPGPRRAGVSSFGFGGANAHVVLEEYIPRARRSPAGEEPRLIALSAKNGDRLKDYVRSLRAHLEKADVDLIDLAYTLQVGRDEMPERLSLVVSSTDELKRELDGFLQSGETPRSGHRNNVRNKPAASAEGDGAEREKLVRSLVEGRDLPKLAELWTAGAQIDWRSLYVSEEPRRVSAPTYPFARDRYWIPAGGTKAAAEPLQSAASDIGRLHPLVHRNVSTLAEQKFASRFTGAEFFLADHSTATHAVLPAAAHIEMVSAAGEIAAEQQVRSIRNMALVTPLTVQRDAIEVEVLLAPVGAEVDFTVMTKGAGEPVVHSRGKLVYASATISGKSASPGPASLDIAAIRERCTEAFIPGSDLYPFLCTSALQFGPGFRVVQEVRASHSECLAVLQLPEHLRADADRFRLHPALLDGGMHTAIGLVKRNRPAVPWSLPYSVGEVQIYGSLRDVHYVHATWDLDNVRDEHSLIRIHLAFADKDGACLVRVRDLVAKPFLEPAAKTKATDAAQAIETRAALESLVPIWSRARVDESRQHDLPDPAGLLLLGNDPATRDWVLASFPAAQFLDVSTVDSDALASELAARRFDHLLWAAPDLTQDSLESIIAEQERGVLAVFRIVKGLLHAGFGNKSLQWTILTRGTQQVTESEPIRPAHAGIAGLVGSLAKEYPHWDLRLLDLDSVDAVTARECLALPCDKLGNALAHRRGEWFRQSLALLETPPPVTTDYREGGVYVVIGGAGGVGEVWTRFMIEHYQAHVVWIGRRAIDDAIEKKIDALSRLGPAPLYVTADARDADALERARERILRTYPAIHGVVHSAIVLEDQSIGRMEEAAFRAGLSAKVDVSVNMADVFGRDALDLMLFFSSIVSFVKSPGQSNYSAGCTFKDAFAQSLRQGRSHPVKVMNWGYWGNVGVVADESYNRAMAQMGIGSIEPEEGMAALQRLAGSDLRQLVVLKTLNSQPLAALNVAEVVSCQSDAPAILPAVERVLVEKRVGDATGALEAGLPTPDMIDLATRILAASLVSVGLFRDGVREIAQLSLENPPAPYYERWLRSSVRHLQERDILGEDLALRGEVGVLSDLWREWEARSAQWMASPSVQAQVTLLGACLKALPGILTGQQLATDVMFPKSSVELVEGIYRGNPLADHFNDVLAATLVACVEQLLAGDGTRALRILEIGAGTGGTTAKLLPTLRPYAIEEYRYTDISKAFLLYADKQFGRDFPALKTAIFDVTKPLAAQTITPAHYDIVIAANVLHATPDIRETLRNAKATLRNQGVLLLNELSTWSLFTHLTFGLLEGWWLHEDTAVRLQGNPALAPDRWRELLAAEGFPTILFPAEKAHEYGQQIIAAASDGRTRQRMARRATPPPAAPEPLPEKVRSSSVPKPTPRGDATAPASAERKEQMISEHVRRVITEKLAESLRMDAATIRGDEPFADYGVDSIIGVNLVRTINEALQIELETTSLFEYSTVNDLTAHVLQNWSEAIAGRIAPAAGIASEPASVAAEVPPDRREEAPPRFTGAARFAAAASNVVNSDGSDRAGFGAEPIAVIGMSGRFAQSDSLDAFWENLAEGKDLVTTVSRWSAGDCVIPGTADHAYSSHGSFIDSIDLFDRAFFGISAEEATCMDPQQRLFLEESWKALEDAGYAGKGVQEKQCGVYVGCGSSKYGLLFAGDQPAQAFWGNSESVIPARIAYHLDLHGPAVAIDTACSSSLVAIHLACQGLWTRETEMALAGGVFLQPTPSFYQVANRAGMLSPDGKCYSFDARANGFVPGEGVGVVVLKRLKDALSDGDHIHGVIVGSGINQDGRSNGLTAPNGRAQERLERSVYERFGIHPETIQLLEAHGTGTLLGDSIEYGAITRSFRQQTQKRGFCALGTVKTNIGHAATAAGIAGVLKVLLALKHRRIPPSLHFERSSPGIDLDSGPFYVNSHLCDWVAGEDGVRRAAVSAFGFSGTNAHLVIEAPPVAGRCTVEAPAYLVPLSARTAGQLRLQVENLLARLRSAPGISINDLSFSLVAGRMHLSHRLACVARSQDDLIQSLEQWLQTGNASRIHAAEVPQSGTREQASLRRFGTFCIQECREAASVDAYEENLAAIAELHVQGYSLDLSALFAGESRRIPLPTYPFARERYWVDAVPPVRTAVPPAPARLQIAATPAESEIEWVFSRNGGMAADSIAPAEKMELFLRQEAALQLKKPIDEIPSDRTYFDLGMSSLGMTHLVENTGRLLDESLSPGVLFDYSDIRSLAAFLARTYPAGVRAVTAVRAGDGQRAQQIACPESQEVPSSAAAPSAALSVEQILESISWQSASVADGYEKVTF